MTDRPNFVLIVTDQHCADWLGCAGHSVVKTPNIDRLAARGLRFTEFHTASPVCMPNRASLLTGRYPSVHGLKYNGCALTTSARTFVERLGEEGYRTAAIGKSHLQPFTGAKVPQEGPRREAWKYDFKRLDIESPRHYEGKEALEFPAPYYGYDHVDMVTGHGDTAGGHYLQWLYRQDPNADLYRDPDEQLPHDYTCPQAKRTRLPEELYPTRYIEKRACDWLQTEGKGGDPFFLFVSFPDPHHPFNPPGHYWDKYNPDQFVLDIPATAFADPPPPLRFALDQHAKGILPQTPQEAIAVSDAHAREAMALTAGMLAMIDDAVGRILGTLDEAGLGDNTVVIFTSDHGDYLGDANLLFKGPWMRRSIHHVPFIWADPRGRTAEETPVLGSTLDIAPTILSRAGVEGFFGIQGRDLLADLDGGGRDALLIEFNDNSPRMGMTHAARARTIYRPDTRLTFYPREGWAEFFLTGDDPHHLRNRWNDETVAPARNEMLCLLTEMVTLTMDESPRALMRA